MKRKCFIGKQRNFAIEKFLEICRKYFWNFKKMSFSRVKKNVFLEKKNPFEILGIKVQGKKKLNCKIFFWNKSIEKWRKFFFFQWNFFINKPCCNVSDFYFSNRNHTFVSYDCLPFAPNEEHLPWKYQPVDDSYIPEFGSAVRKEIN